jgi:dihydropteroate synthase
VGASRKRFIGAITGADEPRDRMPGSVAAALHALSQGVQILRVHDTLETRQAMSLQMALIGAEA